MEGEIYWCCLSDVSQGFFGLCLLGEDAEEDEVEENPIAVDFQDVQDAFYVKDPRKALQGFFDREGNVFFFFIKCNFFLLSKVLFCCLFLQGDLRCRVGAKLFCYIVGDIFCFIMFWWRFVVICFGFFSLKLGSSLYI